MLPTYVVSYSTSIDHNIVSVAAIFKYLTYNFDNLELG